MVRDLLIFFPQDNLYFFIYSFIQLIEYCIKQSPFLQHTGKYFFLCILGSTNNILVIYIVVLILFMYYNINISWNSLTIEAMDRKAV